MTKGLLASFLFACAAITVGCTAGPDLSSGPPQVRGPLAVTRLELPYRTCNKPQRVGDAIYAIVTDEGQAGSAVVRWDTRSASAETIVKAPGAEMIGWFVVNDRWLVYSIGTKLFARPLAEGSPRLLSEARDLYAPALSGDRVAFDDLDQDRKHRIVVHDLSHETSTVVAAVELADLYNNFPAWDGNRLVWTDVIEGVGTYRSHDVVAGTTRDSRLTEGDHRFPGYANPSGDNIFSINFQDVDEWNWGAQRVGYFSGARKEFIPLEPQGFVANSLDVAGGLVAIVDDKQRLTIRLAESPETAVYRPVQGRVDFVEASWDGALIAWREGRPGSRRTELFVIERR